MEDYKNEFYTLKFRKAFLRLILQDRIHYDIFSPYLYESVFSEKDLKIIYKCIKSIYKKHDNINFIQQGTLESEVVDFCISKSISEQVFLETVKDIYDLDIVKQEDVLIQKARKWVLRERLIKALAQSVDLLKANEDEPEKILTLIQNAVTTDLDATSYSDFSSFDNLLDDIKEERGSDVLVSTGFPTLDKYFIGGFGAGEIHIVLGGAKAGKSTYCVQTSVNTLKQYKTVIYISYELSDTLVRYKHACCMTGMTYEEIIHNPELYKNRLKKFADIFQPKLFIKKYPAKKADVYQIKGFIQSLITQRKIDKVDLIIIDYDDLLKPTINRRDKYDVAEQQYIDMINLAEYFNCPVLTPAQTNRSGWEQQESDGTIITSSKLACSAAKRMYCNSIVTLNPQGDNDVVVYVDTNRFGKQDVQILVKSDLERNRFVELKNSQEVKLIPDVDDDNLEKFMWEKKEQECLEHQKKMLDKQAENVYKEVNVFDDGLNY